MAFCAKKTMSDESRYFSRDEEFVFGDFPSVENSINLDRLDFLLLFDQAKSKKKKNHYYFPKDVCYYYLILLFIDNIIYASLFH